MKNPTHCNEMLRIVLDLAMVYQSVLELTFRRPMPGRPDAVRRISRSRSLRIYNEAVPNESVFQPWVESPLITAVILEQLDSQDEKTQTTAVLGACKMLLLRMVDSSDVSGLSRSAVGRDESDFEIAVARSAHSAVLCT